MPNGNSAPLSVEAMGYDPDENSDCTEPEELNLKDKSELLKWKFLDEGHRLSHYIPTIPHVNETKVVSSVTEDELTYMEFGTRLAGLAKQVQTEFVYAKQRFDLLQQERDLLKWHIASNSKVLKVKEGRLGGIESRSADLEQKLKSIRSDVERLERERTALSSAYRKSEEEMKTMAQDYANTQAEMEEWLGRQGDFVADTTYERRKAGHERRLRYRQWKKLARACAVDKKWHVRIDATRNADAMIFEAFDSTDKLLAAEFRQAADITGPIRQIITEQIAKENPLDTFAHSSSRQEK